MRETDALIRGLSAGHLLADRAFDADWLRADLIERDIIPVIPPKSNRKFPAEFDKETYKWRHLIENYFGKLKENRGIAMRSCKTDQSFKAFIAIAATLTCSIPDDHIDPRRSAFFMARSILRDIRSGVRAC